MHWWFWFVSQAGRCSKDELHYCRQASCMLKHYVWYFLVTGWYVLALLVPTVTISTGILAYIWQCGDETCTDPLIPGHEGWNSHTFKRHKQNQQWNYMKLVNKAWFKSKAYMVLSVMALRSVIFWDLLEIMWYNLKILICQSLHNLKGYFSPVITLRKYF